MRSIVALFSVGLFALVATAKAKAADDIDKTLEALDERGKTLADFTAQVKLTETDPALGVSNIRLGQVWFQRKAGGDARFHVMFDKKQQKIQGRNMGVESKIEYLYDDGWLTDRDYSKKIEVKRQVVAPGQKINLLKLGEGPFPLPIGQSKEDVRAQFDVSQAPPGDTPNTVHLVLKPKDGTSLARRFSSLDVWVDPKLNMPVRIDTLDAGGGEQRRTDLSDIKINASIKDPDFALAAIDANWSRTNEPFKAH